MIEKKIFLHVIDDDLGPFFLLLPPPGVLTVQTAQDNTSHNLGIVIYVKCQYMSAVTPFDMEGKKTGVLEIKQSHKTLLSI